ncbi:MAG: methyltransferase domain-containing protein [Rhizomicrobium sp.]
MDERIHRGSEESEYHIQDRSSISSVAMNPLSFVCPADKSPLLNSGAALICPKCEKAFPFVNGVPVLINEDNSVFRISDYTQGAGYGGASSYGGSLDKASGFKRAYRRFARLLSEADVVGWSFNAIEHIMAVNSNPKILVIGAGDRNYPGDVVYTDVTLADGVSCICDAHDIPFADNSFDAVFADAVLEHVCDPQRCVSEIARVLKPRGFVMAVTPFLQPVHMGAYDFTRFTYLGHRRLFRHFDDIQSGPCGGPVYSWIHLFRNILLSLSDNHKIQSAMRFIGLLLTYPVRWLEKIFPRTQTAYNSACAFYFLGRLREQPIPDREIISMFRGR